MFITMLSERLVTAEKASSSGERPTLPAAMSGCKDFSNASLLVWSIRPLTEATTTPDCSRVGRFLIS